MAADAPTAETRARPRRRSPDLSPAAAGIRAPATGADQSPVRGPEQQTCRPARLRQRARQRRELATDDVRHRVCWRPSRYDLTSFNGYWSLSTMLVGGG